MTAIHTHSKILKSTHFHWRSVFYGYWYILCPLWRFYRGADKKRMWWQKDEQSFSNFSCMFLNPNNFSNLNSNCSNLLDLRNLQEQVKKAKLFRPFTVWIDCSSDLKMFANSWPSASNFKSSSLSLEQFFLTVDQNIFGNKVFP